jgi:uncharacterized Tic20 family protein
MNKEITAGVTAGVVAFMLFLCTNILWGTVSSKIYIINLMELLFKIIFSLIFLTIFLIFYNLMSMKRS